MSNTRIAAAALATTVLFAIPSVASATSATASTTSATTTAVKPPFKKTLPATWQCKKGSTVTGLVTTMKTVLTVSGKLATVAKGSFLPLVTDPLAPKGRFSTKTVRVGVNGKPVVGKISGVVAFFATTPHRVKCTTGVISLASATVIHTGDIKPIG